MQCGSNCCGPGALWASWTIGGNCNYIIKYMTSCHPLGDFGGFADVADIVVIRVLVPPRTSSTYCILRRRVQEPWIIALYSNHDCGLYPSILLNESTSMV